jgi:chemotaxis protein methyltransferase CheR
MPHLVRYFTKRKDQWAVNQNIKSRVDFRQLNLMTDFSSFGVFDVIFCRNVLIYFAPDQKRDVLNRLARCLAPDGFLVLGAAESVIGYSSEFKPHADNRVILTRRAAQGSELLRGAV